jgi:tripartite-type tricarboxylate transporter receptor subunit TctC
MLKMTSSPASLLASILATCLAATSLQAAEPKYPEKAIRIVVPVAAGGSADAFTRLIAQKMTAVLSQGVTVDNRPGANGMIGTDIVAKSPPDGYTLLLGATPTLAINATLYAGRIPYNPERDFIPIALVARITPVLAVHPSLPARNLKEFIALAKSNPGKLNYGSSGVGSGNHLVGEMLKTEAGINMVHVPFGGGAPALVAVLSGQIEIIVTPAPTLMPMIKVGRIRPLAVSGSKRLSSLPDVPTISESGFTGFEAESWYCIAAPAGTSKAVIARLHSALMTVVTSPEYRERLVAEGATADSSTPEEAAVFVRNEIPKWARVVKAAGVKPD